LYSGRLTTCDLVTGDLRPSNNRFAVAKRFVFQDMEEIREAVKQLLIKHDSGLSVQQLDVKYRELYQTSIPVSAFNSLPLFIAQPLHS
jgi:hypothetical protein